MKREENDEWFGKQRKSSNKAQLESFWTFEGGRNKHSLFVMKLPKGLNFICRECFTSNMCQQSPTSLFSLLSSVSLSHLSLHLYRTFSTTASAAVTSATTPCEENPTSGEDEADLCDVPAELHQNWQRMQVSHSSLGDDNDSINFDSIQATTYRRPKPVGWTLISSARTRTQSSLSRWNMLTAYCGSLSPSVVGREARFGLEACTTGRGWNGSGDITAKTWRINHLAKWIPGKLRWTWTRTLSETNKAHLIPPLSFVSARTWNTTAPSSIQTWNTGNVVHSSCHIGSIVMSGINIFRMR